LIGRFTQPASNWNTVQVSDPEFRKLSERANRYDVTIKNKLIPSKKASRFRDACYQNQNCLWKNQLTKLRKLV